MVKSLILSSRNHGSRKQITQTGKMDGRGWDWSIGRYLKGKRGGPEA